MTFTCPRCRRVSHHPDDVVEGYCGACHWWTGRPVLLIAGELAGVMDDA